MVLYYVRGLRLKTRGRALGAVLLILGAKARFEEDLTLLVR